MFLLIKYQQHEFIIFFIFLIFLKSVFFREFGIINTFTLEGSFGNYISKENKIIFFNKEEYFI